MKKMFLPIALGLLSTCGMSCEISAMAVNRDITLAQGRDNLRLGYHLSAALIEEGMSAGATVADAAQMVSDLRSVQANLTAAGYNADGTDLTNKTDVEKAQRDLATVTGERDTARADLATAQADLATVTGEKDAAQRDLATAQANLATVTGERDTARANLATAQTNLTTVTGERDTARADLAAVRTNLTTAGYNADGTGLTSEPEVTEALQGAGALDSKGFAKDGSNLLHDRDSTEAAVDFVALFSTPGNDHLMAYNPGLWRAARGRSRTWRVRRRCFPARRWSRGRS